MALTPRWPDPPNERPRQPSGTLAGTCCRRHLAAREASATPRLASRLLLADESHGAVTLPPLDSPSGLTAHCTRCGGPVYPGDRFCGGCGYSLTVCATCGNAVMPGAAACSSCGSALIAPPAVGTDPAQQSDVASLGDPAWGAVVERLRTALANEFEIDGELGRGGMAAVFRARDLALNRR